MLQPDGHLLRIFIGESDKKDGAPLYQWIVRAAKREGLSGATVLRGMEGFGAHSKIHDSKFLDMSADLPIIIEIVDTLEKIDAFLPTIDAAIIEGMATVEPVHVRFYRGSKKP
jgi:PII-like signaling protein